MTPDASAEIQALTNEVKGNWGSSGVNLYVGSPSFDGYNARSNWTKQTETYNGHAVYKRSEAWGGAYALISLTEGTYTFSVAVKTSDGGNVALFGILNNISTATIEPAQSIHVATSTSWTRKSLTFTVTQAGTVALRIEKEGSGDIYVSEYQLEKGSAATPYQPYAKTNVELTADVAVSNNNTNNKIASAKYGHVNVVTMSGASLSDGDNISAYVASIPISNNVPWAVMFDITSGTNVLVYLQIDGVIRLIDSTGHAPSSAMTLYGQLTYIN